MIAQPHTSEPTPQKKSLARRLALPLAGGAISGFLGALLFLNLTEISSADGLGASRDIAGLVGVLYILTGLAVGLGSVSPKAGARFLNVEDADELREGKRMLTLSAVATVALGGALVLLALSAPVGPLAPLLSAGGAIVLIACATALSVVSRRLTDEMQRELSRDATRSAFAMLLVVGGGWALLAHTGFIAAPAPLDWLTMFAVFLLIGCFWQGARRGLMLRGPN